jgi:hypothetical protein
MNEEEFDVMLNMIFKEIDEIDASWNMNEKQFNVMLNTISKEIDEIWNMNERNDQFGMMDHICLEQTAQLELAAEEIWKILISTAPEMRMKFTPRELTKSKISSTR